MPPRERLVDRGTLRARAISVELGAEIRRARVGSSLTQDDVAEACGITGSYVSLIERGLAKGASMTVLARITSVVGLDLTVRAYPGGSVLRDAPHRALLERLHAAISPALGWRTEVPLPNPGDQRAWDAMIVGHVRPQASVTRQTGIAGSDRTDPSVRPFRIGVEAETRPRDAQALQRRLALKRRDGGVDHVVLVLAATRGNRAFLRAAGPAMLPDFPVPGRAAIKALSSALDPGGSAIIVI